MLCARPRPAPKPPAGAGVYTGGVDTGQTSFAGAPLIIGTGAGHVFRVPEPPGGALASQNLLREAEPAARGQSLQQIERPTFLAHAGPPGAARAIYGVNEIGHGQIFRLGGPVISSGGAHPCHISAHPSGQWLYVSNYSDGCVRAVELTGGGEFGEIVDLPHSGSGPNPDRQQGPHAHFSRVVDNRLITADLGTDELRVYHLTGGRPEPDPGLIPMPPGSGPRHFTPTPGGTLVVTGELDGTITEVDPDAGGVVRTVPAARAPGAHALSHIDLVDTGQDHAVIAAVRGSNTLSVFTSELELLAEVPTVNWPRHFAITAPRSGDDGAVIVAGERADEVAWHPLRIDDGQVTVAEPTRRVKVPTPMFIGVGEAF